MCKIVETKIRSHQPAFAANVLAILSLSACVAADVPSAPLATLAGSEQASRLGVGSWDVLAEGDNVRVIGRDVHARPRAEMIMRRMANTSDERVQIEAVFPEHGVFEVTRDGVVDGASSEFLRNLGMTLYADMHEGGTPVIPGSGDGLGTAISASFKQGEGHIELGWSAWGYSANIDVNGYCLQGTRDYFDAYPSNQVGSCWVNRWTSDSQYDCRINLHYAIHGWATDTCNWFVYSNPL